MLCLRPGTLLRRHGCKDLGDLLARGTTVRFDLPDIAAGSAGGAAPVPEISEAVDGLDEARECLFVLLEEDAYLPYRALVNALREEGIHEDRVGAALADLEAKAVVARRGCGQAAEYRLLPLPDTPAATGEERPVIQTWPEKVAA